MKENEKMVFRLQMYNCVAHLMDNMTFVLFDTVNKDVKAGNPLKKFSEYFDEVFSGIRRYNGETDYPDGAKMTFEKWFDNDMALFLNDRNEEMYAEYQAELVAMAKKFYDGLKDTFEAYTAEFEGD